MDKALSVAVIIPAYNEERLIGETLDGVPAWIGSIIVVDDASADSTARIVRLRRGKDRRIILCCHRENGGVGKALSTGYREFLRGTADIAVVVNGDAQMDPRHLEAIIAPLRSGTADYVRGNRFGRGEVFRKMPFRRLVGNLALSLLVSAVAFRPFMDPPSGYTAITREALSSLDLDRIYPRYGAPVDILLKLHKGGWRIGSAPARTIYNGSASGIRAGPYVRAVAAILKDHYGTR